MTNVPVLQIVQFQPDWQAKFEAEKAKLEGIFGDAAFEIGHFGSTAIEGMSAKPIIDLAVMIESQKDADAFTEPLAEIGYRYDPPTHAGVPERHYYVKGNPVEYNLSLAYTDAGGYWPRQVLFCDALRSSQGLRDEYAALKRELLRQNPPRSDGYTGGYSGGKTEFVRRVLRASGWQIGQTYSGPRAPAVPLITEVVPREDLYLGLKFGNAEEGKLRMEYWFTGAFPEIADEEEFKTAHVVEGIVEFDCGITVCPRYAYLLSDKVA